MPLKMFDFEQPLAEIDKEIEKLREKLGDQADLNPDELEDEKPAEPTEPDEPTQPDEPTLPEEPVKPVEEEKASDNTETPTVEPDPSETGPEPDEPEAKPDESESKQEKVKAKADEPKAKPKTRKKKSPAPKPKPDPEAEKREALIRDLRLLGEKKATRETLEHEIYDNLTAWNRIQIARHIDRPRALDFINGLLTDWNEFHGDRNFRDDPAAVCGMGRFEGEPLVVIAQQKGKDTKENVARNFGMMHPEGYRKAMRIMRLAERFHIPILILIDTPGAYPGIGAEERGQSEAIARNIMEMFGVKTPIIGVIIGEGASGGALGVGVVDHMMMFENSWYCVISPEGCASILFRDASKAPEVATVLQLTAKHLHATDIVDGVVPEPQGGAHRDPGQAVENLRAPLKKQLKCLQKKSIKNLLDQRFQKYRSIGVIAE